jgi:hypothetical protein
MNFRDELQNIISGTKQSSEESLILSAANYLREGQKTSRGVETVELSKDEEAAKLIEWIESANL